MKTVVYSEKYKGLVPFRQGLFTVNPDGSGCLIGNRCMRCGLTFFPGREFCIECYQRDHLESVELDTKGVLHTFTVVYRATPDFETPFMVGYIDLKKSGVRIFAPISDCREEDLSIGMPMELVFAKLKKSLKDKDDRNRLTYQFRPSG